MKTLAATALALAMLPAIAGQAAAAPTPGSTTATAVTSSAPLAATEWRRGVTRVTFGCDAFPSPARTSLTRSVTIGDRGTLLVAVCANPSTGYRWTTMSVSPLLRYVARSYTPPTAELPGAAGHDLLRFVAVHAGSGRIVLAYRRPWTSGPALWTLTLRVTATATRPAPPAPAASTASVTCDQFAAAQDASGHAAIVRAVTATGSFTVTLCSNPSTGFSWEQPAFDAAKVALTGHTTNPAASGAIGAAGTETWTFKVLAVGDTQVSFTYSQPWSGGEKGVWAVALSAHAG